MKNRKKTSLKAASVLLAAMISGSMASIPADVFAAGITSKTEFTMPLWVPDDYESAVQFMNEHGATYTRDNVICFCVRVHTEENVCDGDAFAIVKDHTCSYSTRLNTVLRYESEYDFSNGAPKRSDYPDDPDTWFEVSRAYDEWCANKGCGIRLMVWTLEDRGTFSIVPQYANHIDYDTVYEFERKGINGQLYDTVQTGWFSWMPDCEKEYDRFCYTGAITHRGKYVICRGGVNASTGQQMNITTDGTGELGEFKRIDCTRIEMVPVDGSSSKIIQYAEAQKAGSLTVTVDNNIPWAPENEKIPIETAELLIKDNLQVVDANADPHCLEDWVPTDYESAVAFDNQYGITHIQEGCICFCAPCSLGDVDLWDNIQRELVDPPTAIADYDIIYDQMFACDYSAATAHGYHVYVIAPKTPGAIDVSLMDLEPVISSSGNSGRQRKVGSFSFTVNPDAEIIETDLYGWMPDCYTEFRDYVQEHGEISVHDNYLVCAVDVNFSTGADYDIQTTGTGEISEFQTIGCSLQEIEACCGSSNQLIRYATAKTAGDLTVSMDINIPWAPDEYKDPPVTKAFTIADDLTFHEILPPLSYDVPDWAPADYVSANDFFNQYGKTLVKNGYICLCYPYIKSDNWNYVLMDNRQTGKFDPNTFNGASFDLLADTDYQYPDSDHCYHVSVLRVASDGLIDLGFYRCPATATQNLADTTELVNLTFKASSNTITETDLFGWLPDCAAEWSQWKKTYGSVKEHNQYLVYCGTVSGACDVDYETAGETTLTNVGKYYLDYVSLPDQTPPAPGIESNVLYVYQAEQPGLMTVKIGVREYGRIQFDTGAVLRYNVDDQLNLHTSELAPGDLNGDTNKNVADAVAFVQYLHGERTLSGEQIMCADLNYDFKVNAIDFTLFKRSLLVQQIS